MDLSAGHFWEPICAVDVTLLAAFLTDQSVRGWIVQGSPDKPQRLFSVPRIITRPIIDKVFDCFPSPRPTVGDVMLSRMRPGQVHGMHVDQGYWMTRVHVPIITNPACWLLFEDQGERFHLPVGQAYTFNAAGRRHAFGNEGKTERVHLLFDVIRGR
jgi:Aspartyl/Asparaginyl beta-hydroxylase